MKINYIKTIGFRKFKNTFETELYNTTTITGKNRSGKSNVLYAIINILLGTNLSGDEKASLINKNSDTSYGELHFTDNNGINHVLIRGKHKYSSKGNFVSLDGKAVTQQDLMSFYRDKKLFLSIINPLYFLNKRPAEQKEMVDKYISDIKPIDIFNTLNEKLQNKLIEKYFHVKTKDVYDRLSTEELKTIYDNKVLYMPTGKYFEQLSDEKIKETILHYVPIIHNARFFRELSQKEQIDFINEKMFNIFMDIAYENLTKEEQSILEGTPRNIPEYIAELNGDIKRSDSVISNLNGKIEYAQNIVNEKLPKAEIFEKDEELSLARQELAFLNTNQAIIDKEKQKQTVEKLQKEILDKETESNEFSKKMKEGKKKYLAIKNGECSTCPTCNQEIKDKSKAVTIDNLRNELVGYFNQNTKLQTELKDLELKLTIEKCNYHALEGDTTTEKSKRIAVIEENIKALENEKSQIEKINNEISLKAKTIANAKSDIAKFNEEKQSHECCIENLNKAKKVAQKLYISYIEGKMNLAKKHLKDVDIKFYSVLKTTGEIKDDFIITYKNNPLSDLSRSETIATALEFANMFNKITGANFPIFIDDSESCADYDFINQYSNDTQLIISKVEKGNLLKISDASSDNYTIIKPIIKGFKTINTYKNNVADIPKAA